MRIGSLFSGIGGLELGLERAGVGHTVWQVESNLFCREVLAKHWPEAERFEDVRKTTGLHNICCDLDEDCGCDPRPLEPVDIICGGFPCQDISLAGKGRGLEGKRSGLWWEFDRIIRELRPRYVVVENVPALRSRGLGGVLGALAESGYDAKWDCIPAQAIGAPHRRDRLYLVAWRVSDAERHPLRDEPERGEGSSQESDSRDAEPAHMGAAVGAAVPVLRRDGGSMGSADRGGPYVSSVQWWPPRPDDLHAWGQMPPEAQPALCGVTHGLPRRVERLRALGNAVVPQVAEVVGQWIQEREG